MDDLAKRLQLLRIGGIKLILRRAIHLRTLSPLLHRRCSISNVVVVCTPSERSNFCTLQAVPSILLQLTKFDLPSLSYPFIQLIVRLLALMYVND